MKSFEEQVNSDEIYLDDEDREYLDSLTETQREKVLYDRHEKLRQLKEKKQLESLDSNKKKANKEVPLPVIKYEDCDFIVDRALLVNNVFKPNFSMFKSCFVRARINVGYKICKIAGFSEAAPYVVNHKDYKNVNTYLNLDLGEKILKSFPISNISSGKILQEEYNDFIKAFQISSFDDIKKRHKSLIDEMKRKPTDSELTAIIENRMKANPKKKSVAETKMELIRSREEAIQRKDKINALKYQGMLEKIEDEERAEAKKRSCDEMKEIRKRLQNE
jgi:Plus-3 domain